MTLSIVAAAAISPAREALVVDGERLSFERLAVRVEQRIAALGELGDAPVALVVDGSLIMFELLYALIELGVPVLPIHPRLTPPERSHLMTLSGASRLLDPSRLERDLPPSLRVPSKPVPSTRALVLVPSSGSTGTPKLVELSRGAFSALAQADAQRVPPLHGDRALACLPLSHVGGLSVLLRALAARRTLVSFRPGAGGLLGSLPELAHALIAERISLVSLVPPILSRLLREEPEIATRAPLRAVLLGGMACSEALFEQARERGVPVLTSYGLTEACSQVSTLGFPPPARVATRCGVVSVGTPLAGIELRIDAGRIALRGPTLFTRYVGQPSVLDADGFFDTGDRGELDPEHGLFVFGRDSELIISGGENVDPTEVEHALLACGPLSAACVFGIPDSEFGSCVVAALELTEGARLDEPALFGELDRRLASFKQPRRVCVLKRFPRLASGKLDRPQIRGEATPRLRPAQRAPRP